MNEIFEKNREIVFNVLSVVFLLFSNTNRYHCQEIKANVVKNRFDGIRCSGVELISKRHTQIKMYSMSV